MRQIGASGSNLSAFCSTETPPILAYLSTLLDAMLDTSHDRAEASSRRWKLSHISGELYEAKGVVVRASGENIVA